VKFQKTKTGLLAIVCVLIVIGIFFVYDLPATPFQSTNSTNQGTTTKTITPPVPLRIDADFEIQEANVSIVNYINSTPISSEQLQKYPELERHLQGVKNNAEVWVQGWKLVADFPGNLSQYNAFVSEVCGKKTRIECNGGMLFEYHDRFYKVYYQQYGTMSRDPNS
jgi:hypothetical protein